MRERDTWIELIPHRGRMALIERVMECEADAIVAESDNHRDGDHPLRSRDVLHAVHLCEYAAQAMAVHGALIAQAAGGMAHPGLLVALREVELHVARIDDLPAPLHIHAWREFADEHAWSYRFRVCHRERELATGRAMVMLQDEPS